MRSWSFLTCENVNVDLFLVCICNRRLCLTERQVISSQRVKTQTLPKQLLQLEIQFEPIIRDHKESSF